MSDYYQDGFIDGQAPYYQPGRRSGNGGRGSSNQGNCRRGGCGGNSQSMPGNRPGGGSPSFGAPPFGQPSPSRPPQRPQPPRPPQQPPRPAGPPPQYGLGPQAGWNQPSSGCNCRGRRRGDLWGQEVDCNVRDGEIDEIPLQPWMWLDSDAGEQYWMPGDYFYPCSGSQAWEDRQNQIDRDLQYFMGMYPSQIQQLVMPVREAVDNRDYEGSFIYDEYPDQNQIDQMVDEVIDGINPEQMPDGNESEQPCPLNPIVKLLVIQEILIRRNR